jgi:peptidyl-prolyl cis-trans isomerase C
MKYLAPVLLAVALGGLAACQKGTGSSQQPAASNSPPVATVNGKAISQDFFDFYVQGVIGKPPTELTDEQKQQALDNLIRAEVMVQKAQQNGLEKDHDTALTLELSRLNVLHQAASQQFLKDKKPTEQELRAEYETQVAALPGKEYRARHILVATEDFARNLVKKLDGGAKFDQLAARESMDSSKTNGGDLGWFTPDRMVKPFADAVMSLKPGEITTSPVQTQFGWHVIKLEETRDLAAPPFDSVRQRLEQLVQAKKLRNYTDELMKTAKVEKKI